VSRVRLKELIITQVALNDSHSSENNIKKEPKINKGYEGVIVDILGCEDMWI
jgi:hypothetical protein